ncbi:MAG: class I SAM-dependent methyltransferase [Desulfatirhabdiaceae bacterium]|nr:class I SAM-dependent methyltransferase [Desulfatirhabdiaceae bacterium]
MASPCLKIVSVSGLGLALLVVIFFILPPMIEYLLRKQKEDPTENGNFCDRVLRRYRNMGAYQRLFARFKLRLDPMFSELPSLLWKSDIRTVADIGCGYGVPACWMLERFADATVYGIDPDPRRVSVASRAVGKRGFFAVAGAPEIPETPGSVDLATMLDMIHFLDDDQFRLTLIRLSVIIGQKGRLIIRATLPPAYPFPWVWWMENLKNRAAGIQCHYRIFDEIETIVRQAGFDIELSTPSGSKGDLVWLILNVRE